MIERVIQVALRNRMLMLVLGAVVVASGYYSYRQLPVDAFPDVSPNLVQVFTVTEGLAPEEIETYVTYPIETVMNGLPGIENIRSVSNFGLSVVNIYFADEVDIYFARQLVSERLHEAWEQIPEGFGEPALGPISTGMGLVLFYYLEDTSGNYSLEELRTIQDWLVKFHLQTVPGVTEILGIGGHEKQFQVVVDPHALLRYGVTLRDVIAQIKANNLNVGAQFIEKDAEEYVVRSVGLASTVEDIENIVIKAVDGTPVFLDQVARVGIGGAIRRGVQTRNGVEEVVAGMVIKLFGTNSSSVIERVEARMEEINRILARGGAAGALLRAEDPGGRLRQNRHRRPGAGHRPGHPGADPLHGQRPPQPGGRPVHSLFRLVRHPGDELLRPLGQPHVPRRPGHRHRHDGGRNHRRGGER